MVMICGKEAAKRATNIHHHDKHDGDNNEHDNNNNEKEVGNDRDRGSRHLHVSSLRYYGMFIFFTFLNILLFFYRLTTNDDDGDDTNDGNNGNNRGLRCNSILNPW